MNILVTASGGALAPMNILLMQSGRRRCRVFAVDSRADATGRHFADGFAVVPPGDDPAYADAVIGLVRKHAIDVVLPWSDEEAVALALRRDDVRAAGAMLAVADTRTLLVMNDKAATYQRLRDAGIATARWAEVADRAALAAELESLRQDHGEAVVKPKAARGNRGTFVIRSDVQGAQEYLGSREIHLGWDDFERDHRAEVEALLPVIVMERLTEPAIDIDILAHRGRNVHAVPRERVNPAGIPFKGSIFRFTPELLALAERVTSALDLSWLYDYDVMYTRDRVPVILEVNPRPSGSIAASIASGVPLYDDMLDLVDGRDATASSYPADGSLSVPYLAIKPARG